MSSSLPPHHSPNNLSTSSFDTVDSTSIAIGLLLMLVSSFAMERSGAPRVSIKWVALACGVLVLLFILSNTHRVLAELISIVHGRGRTLFTPVGIQGFCVDLQNVADHHLIQVNILIATLYLTLQTFCIPGTVALNAAIGALLGTAFGVPVGVVLGTTGATLCYLLSSTFGSRLADAVDHRLMKGKGVPKLRAQVVKFRSELLVYMLFLRLTPILPNWLVNLASPIVHVPLKTFAVATMLGIIPQTYLSVRFGSVVADVQRRYSQEQQQQQPLQVQSIVTLTDTLFMCGMAVLLVILAKLRKRFAVVGAGGGSGVATATASAPPHPNVE